MEVFLLYVSTKQNNCLEANLRASGISKHGLRFSYFSKISDLTKGVFYCCQTKKKCYCNYNLGAFVTIKTSVSL